MHVLSVSYKPPAQYTINLDTESFTLTAQTIFFLKHSPGCHNPQLQSSALVRLCDLAVVYPGCACSLRFTTHLFSKSQFIDLLSLISKMSIDISKWQCHIPILSSSPGVLQPRRRIGAK